MSASVRKGFYRGNRRNKIRLDAAYFFRIDVVFYYLLYFTINV